MLEKTVLQQLQEIFPMEVNREQADTGEKIRLRNDEQKSRDRFLLDGQLEQGYGYKNSEAYKSRMSMKQVIFQNMAIKRMKNKSKKL